MPKKDTITRAEVIDIVKQAEAAANVPELTPAENQAIDQLFKPVLDAMDTNPTTSDTDEQDNQAIAEIQEARTLKRNQLIIAKDHVKTIEAQLKELDEQWLDAVKNKPTVYKEIQQSIFNY